MKIAFIVFDNMTLMDFIGAYDSLTRINSMGFDADFSWKICALTPTVTDDRGLSMMVDCVGEPLSSYDLLYVPGGPGAVALHTNESFIIWLQTAKPVPLKVSVCSGALLLAAAKFLEGRSATTHPGVYEMLSDLGVDTLANRIVEDKNVVTAGGVTSAIDLGLYLVEKLKGNEVRERIARQMDYPYKWNG